MKYFPRNPDINYKGVTKPRSRTETNLGYTLIGFTIDCNTQHTTEKPANRVYDLEVNIFEGSTLPSSQADDVA